MDSMSFWIAIGMFVYANRTGYGTVKTVPLFCGYGTVNFVAFFYAHKRPSPFFYTYPTKKPSFKPINDQFIVAGIMLSSYISQHWISAGSAIICPTHKTLLRTCRENSSVV